MHDCYTSDGFAIGCICTTGQDHDEYAMDQPAGPYFPGAPQLQDDDDDPE